MTVAPDATSPASQVGMEAPLGRNETLIERLMSKRVVGHQIGPKGARSVVKPVNPDGKDAAKAIRDLEAENARLRSAPIPAVQSGAVAWLIPGPYEDTIVRGAEAEEARRRGFTLQPLYLAAPQSEPLPRGVGEDWRSMFIHAANALESVLAGRPVRDADEIISSAKAATLDNLTIKGEPR